MNTRFLTITGIILITALVPACNRSDAGSHAVEAAMAQQPVRSADLTGSPAPRLVGGRCEGCEAVFEFGNRELDAQDSLPGFSDTEYPLRITGTIFQEDGETPAEGVVLYIYHTDRNGIYAHSDTSTGWARRHGDLRGWIRTGADGQYTFYTAIPGAYPSWNAPAHIHPVILEPDGKYYWLEDFYFEGDSLLTERQRRPAAPRGGSPGVLSLDDLPGIPTGVRDFILGANIPDYD